MRLFLTYVLPFHWMMVFALLAGLAGSGDSGMQTALLTLGASAPGFDAGSPTGNLLSTVFATGFGFVAALFLWSLVTAAVGDAEFPGPIDEVSGLAFAGGIAAMSALVLFGAFRPIDGLFQAAAFQVAALGASYVAVHAQRRAASLHTIVEGDDLRAAARLMAAGAAHSSMLSRLSGRNEDRDGAY